MFPCTEKGGSIRVCEERAATVPSCLSLQRCCVAAQRPDPALSMNLQSRKEKIVFVCKRFFGYFYLLETLCPQTVGPLVRKQQVMDMSKKYLMYLQGSSCQLLY